MFTKRGCGLLAGWLTLGVLVGSGQVHAAGPLWEQFRAGPMREVDELVFAVRVVGTDGHWYANFGYFADCVDRRPYYDGGQLCRLNLHTGLSDTASHDPGRSGASRADRPL